MRCLRLLSLLASCHLFVFSGGAAGALEAPRPEPGVAAGHFVRWRDPVEGAFSVEAPHGWSVEGGLVRVSPEDVRYSLIAIPKDRSALVFIGDARIGRWAVPPETGAGAGSAPASGDALAYRSYLPGARFAKWRLSTLRDLCQKPSILATREWPDLALRAVRDLEPLIEAAARPARVDVGTIDARCANGNVAMVAAQTILFPPAPDSGAPSIWGAPGLAGYIGMPKAAKEASQVLARMLRSFQLDADWASHQPSVGGNGGKGVEIGRSANMMLSEALKTAASRQASWAHGGVAP